MPTHTCLPYCCFRSCYLKILETRLYKNPFKMRPMETAKLCILALFLLLQSAIATAAQRSSKRSLLQSTCVAPATPTNGVVVALINSGGPAICGYAADQSTQRKCHSACTYVTLKAISCHSHYWELMVVEINIPAHTNIIASSASEFVMPRTVSILSCMSCYIQHYISATINSRLTVVIHKSCMYLIFHMHTN